MYHKSNLVLQITTLKLDSFRTRFISLKQKSFTKTIKLTFFFCLRTLSNIQWFNQFLKMDILTNLVTCRNIKLVFIIEMYLNVSMNGHDALHTHTHSHTHTHAHTHTHKHTHILRKKCPNAGNSGPHFPVFGLNTEIYGVNLRIQSKNGKIWTIFRAVTKR